MTAEKLRADFIITGASQLVTCAENIGEGVLGVISNGALAALGDDIVWVGPESELRRHVQPAPGLVEVDADGGAVLPGFIDAHTHLVFAGDRSDDFAKRVSGEPYETKGIMTTVEATRGATDAELELFARQRLDRFLSFGVTTLEAKSGYGLTLDQELRLLKIAQRLDHPVEVVRTFLGAHVVPPEYAGAHDEYVRLVEHGMIPALENLAEFCDVWCEDGAFTRDECRTILRAARAQGLGIKVHAEQLAHTGGASLAAEFAAVSADHLEHATEDDADALAGSRTVAVLLPGATLVTGAQPAPARMLKERGVRVALSTDFNPGTSYSENLPLALTLGCLLLKMTIEEGVLGITRNAAAAISRERVLGSLAPGKRNDAVVVHAPHYAELAYHYGVSPVRTVVARSRIAFDLSKAGTSSAGAQNAQSGRQ
ncbi:MAG: imidazolonepropionase [Actinomycetota bacterium]|nr:imidazolonepropionase [Actinomycetota bacterium]